MYFWVMRWSSIWWHMHFEMTNVHFSPGHGMIIDGGINVDAHWGRRLMALAHNNETVEKNCTEPGRRGHCQHHHHHHSCSDTEYWRSEELYWVSALLVFLCGIKITSPSLLKNASWWNYIIKILSAISQDYLHSFLRSILLCFFLLSGDCLWCTDNMA